MRVMAYCLARLLHPDGELALGDGGPIIVPHPGDELMAVAAVVLDEPAFAVSSELPGIWPVAILGKRSRRVYQTLARAPQGGAAPRALRRTGFYVLPGRRRRRHDPRCRRLRRGRSGSFAFECSVGGQLLVVGPRRGRRRRPSVRVLGAQRRRRATCWSTGRVFTAAPGTRRGRARGLLDDARRAAVLHRHRPARRRPAPPPLRVLPAGPLLDRVRRAGRERAMGGRVAPPPPSRRRACAPPARGRPSFVAERSERARRGDRARRRRRGPACRPGSTAPGRRAGTRRRPGDVRRRARAACRGHRHAAAGARATRCCRAAPTPATLVARAATRCSSAPCCAWRPGVRHHRARPRRRAGARPSVSRGPRSRRAR